ncbi:MAG: H(+)/Cl(-) exchange transporter ClcA [Holophagales bacterium]|nr:MAG: H(+)/Cl(-) exchange transporter ClcA [Holophagales bacterium]
MARASPDRARYDGRVEPSETRSREGSRPARSARHLLDQLRRRHERRRRLFPRAIAVGVVAGLVASLFRAGIERAEDGRTLLLHRLHAFGLAGLMGTVLLGASGACFAVWLVRRFEPSAAGSGIPQLKAVLHRLRPMSGGRLLVVKFVGGVSAIASGLALGREGPTIQMGGAIGRLVARWLPSSSHERGVLIASGAGAGLAAAFNAPLAGMMFVLEEIQKNFAPGVFSSTFVACVVADAVSRLLFGQSAVFHTSPIAAPPVAALPLFLVLGALVGILAVLFNRGLLATLHLVDGVAPKWRLGVAAAVGGALALVAWDAPGLIGGGGAMVERALSGKGLVGALLLTLAVRFVLTLSSYGTGAPGGIFAPLLVLGSQAGLAAGVAAAGLLPALVGEPRAWAVAGMAALFAGTVRAPLTGIVLMLEMTDSYSLMLPLLAASFAAQWVTERLGEAPIYDSLLDRELRRTGETEVLEGALMLELDVLPDAPFAGRRVAELGLPAGCLIVALERRGRSVVVTGGTKLLTGDRLQVVVAPQAESAVGALRIGVGVEGGH